MIPGRRGMIAALSVLSVAVLLFAAALARALTIGPRIFVDEPARAPVEPVASSRPALPMVPSETTLSTQDIALAVDNDPFLPDRSRPGPYRLPGEDVFEAPEVPEQPPAPEFRVTGTVVAGDAGLAVIQLDNSPPRVLGLGESLMGYRLDRVDTESATLVGDGRTLRLAVVSGAEASATGSPSSAEARMTAQMLQTLRQRLGDMAVDRIEELQRSGLDPAQLQALIERAMQQGAQRGRGGFMVFRRDTMDVPLRAPGSDREGGPS